MQGEWDFVGVKYMIFWVNGSSSRRGNLAKTVTPKEGNKGNSPYSGLKRGREIQVMM